MPAPQSPAWASHVLWWHAYPLGFVGAPIREPEPEPEPEREPSRHRLRRMLPWLDHVVELGANGLMLGPVFASSTHGYDTLDYGRIDPRLGDADDMDELIAAAHARGIRVCFDGVFNHVSDQHPWYLEALRDGPKGRLASWFDIDWEAPGGPRGACFEGHGSLVTLNLANPGVQDVVVDTMRAWCARGVDAWRLDAAYAVDPASWAQILPRVREAHPEVWFVAELLHGDYAAFVGASTVDSATQYELWKAMWSSLRDGNFFELDWALQRHQSFLETFVPSTFVGNHDVTRIATMIGHELAVLAVTVLMTVGGTPIVYAGDELGFEGLKEERLGGDDAVRPAFPEVPADASDGAAARGELDVHRELIALRRRHPWLHEARTESLECTNRSYRYVSRSRDGSDSIVVELSLEGTARARVLDASGAVLFAFPAGDRP